VRKTLQETKPDLVHVHFVGMLGDRALKYAARTGIPVLGTNHALPEAALFYYGYEPIKMLQQRLPWAFAFLENRIKRVIVDFYQRCSVMTAPSPTACDLYAQWGVARPIVQISNGILFDRFSRSGSAEARAEILARYDIPRARQVIFYAGRTQPEKRVDILLRAVQRLAARRDVHLLIAGGCDEGTRKLARQLDLADRVAFAGYLHPETELPGAYLAADVFASASECEGQGIAFLEAMAAGLPVVAADKYAVKDVVRPGETGFLFDIGDAQAMADRLNDVLSDPALRARMSANAVRLAAEHDLERSVDALEKLMRDMRARSPASKPDA
jgi:glycosyltransferase involved in cell wall biosynthesis